MHTTAKLWAVVLATGLALWPTPEGSLSAAPHAGPADPQLRALIDGPPLENVPLGQQLLVEYQCGSCHRIEGISGARGARGPALVQFGRRSYIAGRVPNTPARLAQWIVDPAALVPGTSMPAMGVTPARARAMAAYLLNLR